MSYIVQVWEQPTNSPMPVSVNECVYLLSELHKTLSGQNPKFVLLAQQLMLHFPGLDESSDDEPECVWTDCELDGKTDSSVYNIGIVSDYIEEVRPFVLQEAKALGLCVMDEQAGEVHLADGKILTIKRQAAPKNELPSTQDILALTSVALARFFSDQGFVETATDGDATQKTIYKPFKKTYLNGWHEIEISAFKDEQSATIGLTLSSHFAPVTNLLSRIDNNGEPAIDVHTHATTLLRLKEWLANPNQLACGEYGEYIVRNRTELNLALIDLVQQVKLHLLPTLELYQTIEGFDQLMNPTPVSNSIFFPKNYRFACAHLITAYLAKNPRLEEICEEFLKGIEPPHYYQKDFEDYVRKCIKFVRAHR